MKIKLIVVMLFSILVGCAGGVEQNTQDMRNTPIVPPSSDHATTAAKLISPVTY